MTLNVTLCNRSKELCCTSSPFLIPSLSSFLLLPTFLNHPSPVWWAPLSSAPNSNEHSLYTCLMVFCISLWLFYFFPHYCTESLYGDATDKPLLSCCACGTAKYRVTFYGNWSEKSHPKDYPRKHKPHLSSWYSVFLFYCCRKNPMKSQQWIDHANVYFQCSRSLL